MTGLPRRFALLRQVDYTGVLSMGVVAYGIAFADGHVAVRWCTEHPSTSIWTSLDDLLSVHREPDDVTVEWIDTPARDRADSSGRRARRPVPLIANGASNGQPIDANSARSDVAPPAPPRPAAAAHTPGTAHPPGRHRRSRSVEQSI
ncbi:MAG: hypothetical protein ICV70_02205 [Jiangellaceae bacterium]|nr:hypothetical protein [Jiangellaceae bacterium]